MAFSGMALAPTQVLLSPTPTSTKTVKPTPSGTRLIKKSTLTVTQLAGGVTATPGKNKPTIPLDQQAGNSDLIVLLGFLIVAVIAIPILLKRKEWWGK